MAPKIGIVLALDNEKQFAAGMKNAQTATKNLDKDLQALSNEYKNNANSLEYLEKKQHLLEQRQEHTNKALTDAKAASNQARAAYKQQAEDVEKLRESLNKAKAALNGMEAGTAVFEKQKKATDDLEHKLKQAETTLARYSGKLDNWDSVIRRAENDVKNNNAALNDNSRYLKEAGDSADKCAHSIDKVGNETADAAKQAETLGQTIRNGFLFEIGAQAADKAFELIKEGMEAAVEVGSDYEKSMSEVAAISGANSVSLDQMSQKAKALGSATKFSATEVAQAFKYMSLAGWDTNQMLSSIDGIVNLAAAGEVELAEASDMVTDYLSAFGLEAEKAGQMADQMAYAQANSNTSVTQLGEAYQNCAANLHAAGQDMETVTAMLEAMANQGTKGHQAGTQLSAMMRDISQKMEDGAIKIGKTSVAVQDSEGNFRDLTDIMRDVEKATQGMGTAEKTAALQKTFTAKSIRAVNQVLTEGVDAVASYEEQLRNAGGAAQDMSNIMQDNLQGEVTRMKSAAEGLGIAIYDGIKEPLTGLAGLAADAISGITEIITGPEKEFNEIDAFLGDVSAGVESVQAKIAQSTNVINEAVSDVGGLEHYKNVIVELNDKENLNAFEKQELKNAIEGVIQAMPELAALYNEETGRLDENTAAIEEQISAKQKLLLEEAKQKVSEQALQTMYEASIQKNAADAAVNETKSRISAIENEKQTVKDLAYEYNDLTTKAYGSLEEQNKGMARAAVIEKELAEHGVNAYEAIHETGDVMAGWNAELNDLNGTLAESEKTQKAANDAYAESVDLYKDGATNAEKAVQDVIKEIDAIDQRNAAAKEGADARTQQAEQARAAAAEERNYAGAVEETSKAVEETSKAVFDARAKYEESSQKAEELNQKYQDIKASYLELKEAAEGYAKAQKDAQSFKGIDEDRYEKAVYDMTRYKAVWDRHGESIEDADTVLAGYMKDLNATGQAAERAGRQALEFANAIKDGEPALGELGAKAAELFDKMFPDAMEKAQSAVQGFFDTASQEIERRAQIVSTSANNIRNAWDQLKESASQTLTFSLETEFDGGADLTTETMNANLQSQLDGYREYVQNLEILRQAMSEGIITPEFFTHLEEQGTSAANEIQHMAWTLENQANGVEQVQGISDKWMQALDMQDQISRIIAGDQAALADGLRSMGSTDADFSQLSNLVSSMLGGVDSEMQTKIQELITTAQTVGATIPEGLADSIKSGNIDAAGIESELNLAITGAMEGLVDVAKDAGVEVPDGMIEGIKDGTTDVEDAYNTLISSISSSTTVSADMAEAAKTAFTTPLANGVREGQEEVVTALTEVTQAAAAAVQTDAFGTAGQDAASQFAAGITSGVTAANTAGNTLAQVARIAANNSVGEWQGVGVNMAAGLAAGIMAGQSNAINAAANMAAQALAAAKARLDIHSPSRKFAKELGRQIPAGTAEGIKAASKVSTAEAEKMSQATLNSATRWLKNYKKKNKVTKQDERYFWAQMASVAIQGSKAYNTAVNNGLKVGLSNNFGVKKTTTTGSGKNKRTVRKDAETYYGEVYSAAQDYFDMLTMSQDMSISAELAYWQKVQSHLRKGTTAYVNAAQKIKSIKEKIGGFDVASDILDSFQVYQEVSEKGLMDYWDLVRKQYAEGTEDRLKADEKYLDAKKKYNDKLIDLGKDYADKVAEATEKYTSALEERVQAIAGAFDIFEEFESESETGEKLLFNMQSQASGYKFWSEQLEALKGRGILASDLIDELVEKGPADTAAIVALNSLTDNQLKEYSEAYLQKMELARKQAEKDTSDIKATMVTELADLESSYQSEVAKVNAALDSNVASLANNIRSIASDQTAAIVQAIASQGQTTAQAITTAQQQSAAQAAAEQDAARAAAEAQAAAARAAEEKKKIQDQAKKVIKTGTRRSKTITKDEKDKRSALWEHIVSTYGYEPTASIYKSLAKLFGISVGNSVTAAERSQILAKMKEYGLRRGARRVPSTSIWMDEEGLGSEMIVSRADNAVLTRVPADSAVYPANLTDNLWEWGAFAPAQLLAHIQHQQAATADYVNRMAASVNIAALNRRLTTVSSPAQVSGGSANNMVLSQMLDLLSRYLPEIENQRDTYLDGRKVSAGLAEANSENMAMRARRVRR